MADGGGGHDLPQSISLRGRGGKCRLQRVKRTTEKWDKGLRTWVMEWWRMLGKASALQ